MAKLIQHTPNYYKNASNAKNIIEPINLENEKLGISIADLVNQFIVSTATYTLEKYEEQYNLPINPSITTEERRSRIKAKMRSTGVVNKTMLQNMINAWTNADIEVIENYPNFTVTIKFVSVVGIPSNMQDVYNAIVEIKPAHLIFNYEFKYRQNKELTSKTHQQLSQFTHQTIREGVI